MMKRHTFLIAAAGVVAGCFFASQFLPAPGAPFYWPRGYPAPSPLLAFGSSITSATSGFDPLDTSLNWWREEFGSGRETTTSTDTTIMLGELGWVGRVRGNAGSISHQVGVWPNNGLYRITTGATATDDGFGLSFSGSGRQPFGDHAGNANWGTVWIFRLNGTANERMSVGSTQSCGGAQVANLGEGFRVRYDTAQGDTNFMFSVVVGGAESGTPVSSGVAVNTNFNTLLVESTVAGTWRFSLNGGTVKTACASGCDITSALTTAALTPCAFLVSAGSAGARTMDVDAWFWRNTR